ncbi:MAG: plastocyanin [Parcubacteria group bacterium Gr01-1014_20]|nr:MAG: plastocyanin [Parcubacteria group bacterium Gr01-1014_20]
MNKNLIVGLVVVVLVVLGVAFFSTNKTEAPGDEVGTSTEGTMMGDKEDGAMMDDKEKMMGEGEMMASVKEFTVEARSFKFSVSEMRVKSGDTVRVVFKNAEGFHDWKLDEFGVKTKQLQAGQEETVEFKVDKTGTFEYYCSVGQHRANGMKGRLIVE